jgi:flagellar hook-length control protein FliK
MPVVGPAPVAAAAPVAAPAAATVEPEPLATQLAGPIVALRSAPRGTHIVTVRVTPENLGPVTVRAHVHDGGMRVELFAPTQDARDALATMLIDLRRDVAAAPGAGGSFSLGLGAGDHPAGGGREQQTPGWGPRNPDAPPSRLRADAPGAYRPAPRPTAGAGTTSLDVFA